MSTKDNFSTNSDLYKQFRPNYPVALFEFIESKLTSMDCAWDCGTGNGQIAQHLQSIFTTIHATDISQKQIECAEISDNIEYSVQPAEKTNFTPSLFDLIIVGQAIHWFDFNAFYAEVNRTAKNNALLVVTGYGKLQINNKIDAVIDHLYTEILGKYWDKERKYIDENYTTIPFPFAEIDCPKFENTYQWTFEHLMGYLNTWSAVKHYIQQNQSNPIDLVYNQLRSSWEKEEIKTVHFPLLLRMGRISK